MKKFKIYVLSILLTFSLKASVAQKLLVASDTLHKTRLTSLTIAVGVTYVGSMFVLNEFWYKDYPRTSFHFFDDSKEWLQMDKAGHFFTSYIVSARLKGLLNWCGVDDKKSVTTAAITSLAFVTSIEILDGFSSKWGASSTDFLSNVMGVSAMIGQEALWNEQRIIFKYSAKTQDYGVLNSRADDLFGTSFLERRIKDYNAQTYWMSINPASFIQQKTFLPKWINIALGYGAEGMFGGFENEWEDNGAVVNRSDVERYRQYYLSFDVDLSRLGVKKPIYRVLLNVLNSIKIPAPTLELSRGRLKMHAIYF